MIFIKYEIFVYRLKFLDHMIGWVVVYALRIYLCDVDTGEFVGLAE